MIYFYYFTLTVEYSFGYTVGLQIKNKKVIVSIYEVSLLVIVFIRTKLIFYEAHR